MAESRVLALKSGQVSWTGSESDVFLCESKGGALVCAYDGKKGGVFFVESSQGHMIPKLIKELFFGFGAADVSVKVLGTKALIQESKNALRGKAHKLANEVEAGGFEAYLFATSGKIRLREIDTGVRVLIVDDSKTIRSLLRQVLSADPEITVVGEASHPDQVEEMIRTLKPTVITLDIHMPGMDGVTLLEKYLPKYPIPTVMVTSISMQEGDYVFRALSIGAVDYIQKPSLEEIKLHAASIVEKIKVASNVKLSAKAKPQQARMTAVRGFDTETVIAIGSSTGGVQALESVFRRFPEKFPPVVVVQHIPPVFSAAFASRLDGICPFEVKEAQDGDEVKASRVLIAPGGKQMNIAKRGGKLIVQIADTAPVNRHKPSVDVLFDSMAEVVGKNAIGVILTGMGADGAKGLLRMKQAGARTIAQDKDSCVVFGMPREAIALGGAELVKPLNEVPEAIFQLLEKLKKSA